MEEIEKQLFSQRTHPSSMCDLGAHSSNASLEKWTRNLYDHAPMPCSNFWSRRFTASLHSRKRSVYMGPAGRYVISYLQNPMKGSCWYGWAFVSNRTRIRRCENEVVTPSFAGRSLRQSTSFVHCTQKAIVAMRAIVVWAIEVKAFFHLREFLLK